MPLCYKDMTFCYSDCTNTACSRHFGPEVEKKAIEWWGSEDAPIAFSDFSDTCPDYQPSNANEKETDT